MRPLRYRARGFTLVELLVVIAIIGVMVGLLLPAVQAAREAARRMACSNNLKQLGVALHNYHDTYNRFPSGKGGTPELNRRYSAMVALLPFFEQGTLYDQIWSVPQGHSGPSTNNAIWNSEIPTLRCPSDNFIWEGPPIAQSGHRTGKSNYLVCAGDTINGDQRWEGCGGMGTLCTTPQPFRGVFGYIVTHKFSDVVDGTSNTLFIAERLVTELMQGARSQVRVNAGVVWNTHTGAALAANPSLCMGEIGPGRFYINPAAVKGFTGDRWGDGNVERAFVHTVLPPNGPSCTAAGGVGGNARGGIIAPSSQHPGGVQAVFGDGSVRFISDNIDTGNLSLPTQNSGPSRYGVWGALGTRSGSEAVASF